MVAEGTDSPAGASERLWTTGVAARGVKPAAVGNAAAMSSLFRNRPAAVRRCTRCTRAAVVVVEPVQGARPVGACTDHMEWVFLLDVDEWTGRHRTV
jgi:hypothetical protein